MPILTPLQRSLLIEIGRSSLGKDFFLSGGTALAAFYLQHRYSLDLDFFTANPAALAQVPAVMQDIAVRLGAQVTFTLTLIFPLPLCRPLVAVARSSQFRYPPVSFSSFPVCLLLGFGLETFHTDEAQDYAASQGNGQAQVRLVADDGNG